VMVKRALPAWDTSRQCCSRHHCRLDIQIGSVVEAITVGLSYHPAVLAWASLSARATNRQCCLEQHCRLKPQASSVVLSITVSSSHKPTVFSRASLLAWATSWQCSLEKHCRLEPRAGSVGSTGHYRVVPGTDTLFLTSLVVLSYRQWYEPHITAGSKSTSEGGFWTDSDVLV
jgi:hypothetical protein